jgi:ribonucleoside-diphosphate reductase beta chain
LNGRCRRLTAVDVKKYIRYIANLRLQQLGFDSIYDQNKNPLDWLVPMLNSVEHANFFENRVTEYSKAATTGTWEEAFEENS